MKNTLFSLAAVAMLLGFFASQAWGQSAYISSGGSNPNGRIYYRIYNNGYPKLIIISPGSWDDRYKPTGVVTIPNEINISQPGTTPYIYTVDSIGDDAFRGCSGLTSVTIPGSIRSIGNCAFRGCSGLTSVTIGRYVRSIGDSVVAELYTLPPRAALPISASLMC